MPSRKRTCYACGPTEKSLHRFPLDADRQAKWLSFCKSPDQIIPSSSRLCIDHFQKTDIIDSASSSPSPKYNAIPTIYTPNQIKRFKLSHENNNNDQMKFKSSIADKFKSMISKNIVVEDAPHAGNAPAISNALIDETIPVVSAAYSCNQGVFPNNIVVENAPHAGNTLAISNALIDYTIPVVSGSYLWNQALAISNALIDDTIPMVSGSYSCNQRNSENDVNITSSLTTANVSSNCLELTPGDVCYDVALNNVKEPSIEEMCTEVGVVSQVEIESHTQTTYETDEITNFHIPNTPQSKSQLNKRYELSETPTMKRLSNRQSRNLRFTADIRTPDLDTPRLRRQCLNIIRFENQRSKAQLRSLKRQNMRLKAKIKTMRGLLLELQKKNLLSAKGSADILEDLPPILRHIAVRGLAAKKAKYDTEIRRFALTLHFYSPRAYNYVLRKFGQNLLPAASTLRKWACTENFNPGFNAEILTYLKNRCERMDKKPMLCNLVIDEMSIRRQLIVKKKTKYGCVDFGYGPSAGPIEINTNGDSEWEDENGEEEDEDKLPPLAKSSLVFMLVSLNEAWKVPFAYFMVDTLRAKEQCRLIHRALRLLEENRVIVRSITMDGCASNLNTFKQLGACLNVLAANFRPYFPHPTVSSENVYIFLDPCHMLKNVRNSVGKTVKRNKKGELLLLAPLYDDENRKISWNHIENIVDFQNEEGLRATRLTKRHLKFEENKMNVRLAAQTLSQSTASMLEYLEEHYLSKFPDMSGSGTAIFAQHFNNAFDILNFRSRAGCTQYRKPLNLHTIQDLETKAEETINYIRGLTDHQKNPIVTSQRKCGFVGIIVCLKNIFGLFRDLNMAYNLEFLTTYKLLQDHLENFFCCIRIRGGFNNNPNAHQFSCAYRALVHHHQIQSSERANCQFDDIPVLSLSGASNKSKTDVNLDVGILETNLDGRFNFGNVYIPSCFVRDVVDYIAGYIILKMEKNQFGCDVCINVIQDPNRKSALIDIKSKGFLKKPSEEFSNLLLDLEVSIRDNEEKMFSPDFLSAVTADLIKNHIKKNSSAFGGSTHSFEHKQNLISFVSALYVKLRLHHEAKRISEIDAYIRRCYSKLILYKNQ